MARLAVVPIALLSLLWAGVSTPDAGAGADWFPYPVERPGPAAIAKAFDYQPLAAAQQTWRLCAALPHRKDDYWRAVEWGLQQEAARQRVVVDILYAGGYDQLPQQVRQLTERCRDGGYDAVIVAALHEHKLDEALAGFARDGRPVIDLINGVSSRHVTARAQVSFHAMGAAAATYINARCARERKRYRIGWFPGPEGAAWVRQGDEGFRQTLRRDCGEIVHVAFGDTGLRIQAELVQQALQQRPDLDLIVGTAVTAEAASQWLRGRRHAIGVVAYYLNASVFRGLRAGRILAAPTDSPVIQARIAVDLAVRALEKRRHESTVGPRVILLDQHNVYNFQPDFALAPADLPP